MFEIKRFCFLSFTDDIDDRFTLTPCDFVWIILFSHLTHLASPPIKGIAPKRPWRYPLRTFSPFLGEKEANE